MTGSVGIDDVHRAAPLDAGKIELGTDAGNKIALVANINTVLADEPEWLSPDGCHLYISSRRNSAINTKLYLAVRGR